MIEYEVYLRGEYLTSVFYVSDSDEEEVRLDLINHDGYSPEIEVKRPWKQVNKSNKDHQV